MTMTSAPPAEHPTDPPSPPARRGALGPTIRTGALVASGAAMALIVAWDGTPLWRAVRAAAVIAVIAAAVRLLPKATPTVQGWAMLGAGLVTTATGAGIGPRHLVAGPSPLALTAIVALAGGLALAVMGVVELVAPRRGLRGGLLAPAVLAAAYLVMWPLAHAVIATNVAPSPIPDRSPASVGLRYETVALPTADDVTLSAWWIPSTNSAAVVLLHGAGSNRADTLDHAAVLARHGYGVLLLDARGHGASGGRAMDFGWYGDADLDAAVTFLRSQPDVRADRIGAVGLSMGGEEAIGAAARGLRAVVAEGATNRVAADRTWLADHYGIPGHVQVAVDRLTYRLTDLLTDASPPPSLRDSVTHAPDTPVLLVTAGNVPDEALAARFIADGSPATVQIWDVPGTGHTAGLATRPAEWEATVTAFLDRHLNAR